MITLKNESLTVQIAELGAEIKSVVYNNTEYMWNGRAEVWANTAPIMFPICGGLKDDTYTFEGREYHMTRHGIAKWMVFEVENATDDTATLLLRSSEETKEKYPFDFEFRVSYTLVGNAVEVTFKVDNKSDKTMYFNVGSHEAYYTPEGIEDYDVIFDKEETLVATPLFGPILGNTSNLLLKDSKVFPLYDKYFAIDALVFKDGIRSHAATLRNRRTGRAVRVDFPDCEHFLLWHKYAAPFICLEPWNGMADVIGTSYDITEKEGISTLGVGERYLNTHKITFM